MLYLKPITRSFCADNLTDGNIVVKPARRTNEWNETRLKAYPVRRQQKKWNRIQNGYHEVARPPPFRPIIPASPSFLKSHPTHPPIQIKSTHSNASIQPMILWYILVIYTKLLTIQLLLIKCPVLHTYWHWYWCIEKNRRNGLFIYISKIVLISIGFVKIYV